MTHTMNGKENSKMHCNSSLSKHIPSRNGAKDSQQPLSPPKSPKKTEFFRNFQSYPRPRKSLHAGFFQRKKMPVLVERSGNDILATIPDIIECTTAVLPKADKFAVAVGRLSWSAEGIAHNVSDVITLSTLSLTG
jgi:hypothetical protein